MGMVYALELFKVLGQLLIDSATSDEFWTVDIIMQEQPIITARYHLDDGEEICT